MDINSEDVEIESNIDDGLLDAVFDELPGTVQNVLSCHLNIHLNTRYWTDQASPSSEGPSKACST